MKQFSQGDLLAIGAGLVLVVVCLVGASQSPDLLWGALLFGVSVIVLLLRPYLDRWRLARLLHVAYDADGICCPQQAERSSSSARPTTKGPAQLPGLSEQAAASSHRAHRTQLFVSCVGVDMKQQNIGLFYGFALVGLIGTGAMILAWHLTPPSPDRLGYWIVVIFLGWPFLGLMGLLALALRPDLPVRLGVSLLAYPMTAFGLMLLLIVQPLALLLERPVLAFPRGFEGLQLLLWVLAFAAVLSSMLPARTR